MFFNRKSKKNNILGWWIELVICRCECIVVDGFKVSVIGVIFILE